jgi:hypothetical protein
MKGRDSQGLDKSFSHRLAVQSLQQDALLDVCMPLIMRGFAVILPNNSEHRLAMLLRIQHVGAANVRVGLRKGRASKSL